MSTPLGPTEWVNGGRRPVVRVDNPPPVYGHCTACGSVEVRLTRATGRRDLSSMGESSSYPTGYGCEVCS